MFLRAIPEPPALDLDHGVAIAHPVLSGIVAEELNVGIVGSARTRSTSATSHRGIRAANTCSRCGLRQARAAAGTRSIASSADLSRGLSNLVDGVGDAAARAATNTRTAAGAWRVARATDLS